MKRTITDGAARTITAISAALIAGGLIGHLILWAVATENRAQADRAYVESLTDPATGEYIPDGHMGAPVPAPVTHQPGEAAEVEGERITVLAYDDSVEWDNANYDSEWRLIGVQVRVANAGCPEVTQPTVDDYWVGDGTTLDGIGESGADISSAGVPGLGTLSLRGGQSATGWLLTTAPINGPAPASVTLTVAGERHEWTLGEAALAAWVPYDPEPLGWEG